MLKNRWRNIIEMKCECGISVKYDGDCSVSFVDAWRTKEELCECERMKCEHKEFIYIEEDFEEGIMYCECLDCGKQFKKTIIFR